ncbi:MAG: hypothetical protein IJ150_10510 [Bacteroidales bacterium]|nr:hypothetical protein [Bacteroidales bacterium]
MENIDLQDIELLRESVENKFGRKIRYAKDCAELSNNIFEKTGCKISETTLKRLWKLVNSEFNPSKYTLDSLSNYLKFNDFEDFLLHKNDYKQSNENMLVWQQLKNTAAKISKNTITYLKSKLGVSFDKTIKREKFLNTFQDFLNSDKQAYAVVGQHGIGKTVAVMQAAEEMLTNKNYANDILWFFNCSPDNPLNKLNDNLKIVLSTFLGLGGRTSYKESFEKKPAALCGRLVLILDDISSSDILESIISVISAYKNEKYFKTVLAIKPPVWKEFCEKINKKNLEQLFNQITEDDDPMTYSNLDIFTIDEAIQLLENCNCFSIRKFELLVNFFVKGVFLIPGYTEYLITSNKELLTEIELFEKVSEIYSSDYKSKRLIDYLLFATNYGFDTDKAEKSRLTKLSDQYPKEYNKLISYAILSEEIQKNNIDTKITYTKFKNTGLFEYNLALYWYNEFGMTEALFSEVLKYYTSNNRLKLNLFTWFIRLAFRHRQKESLLNMFSIIDKYVKDKTENHNLKYMYCDSIKYYPELQDTLLQKKEEILFYLKEYADLDFKNGLIINITKNFIKKTNKTEEKLISYGLQLLDAFLRCDKPLLEQIYAEIENLDIKVDNSFQYMIYSSCELLYNFSMYGKSNPQILQHVLDFAAEYYNGKQTFSRIDYMLIDTLILTECYETAKILAEKIFELRPIHKLQYAFCLYKLKKTQKAEELFNENINIVFNNLPRNSFYYITLKCCRIAYEITKNNAFRHLGIRLAKQSNLVYYQHALENN